MGAYNVTGFLFKYHYKYGKKETNQATTINGTKRVDARGEMAFRVSRTGNTQVKSTFPGKIKSDNLILIKKMTIHKP